MGKYDALLKNYIMLKEENRILRGEIEQLKLKLVAEPAIEYTEISTNTVPPKHQISSDYKLTQNSSSHQKISLYLSLFKGRSDVCGSSPFCGVNSPLGFFS